MPEDSSLPSLSQRVPGATGREKPLLRIAPPVLPESVLERLRAETAAVRADPAGAAGSGSGTAHSNPDSGAGHLAKVRRRAKSLSSRGQLGGPEPQASGRNAAEPDGPVGRAGPGDGAAQRARVAAHALARRPPLPPSPTGQVPPPLAAALPAAAAPDSGPITEPIPVIPDASPTPALPATLTHPVPGHVLASPATSAPASRTSAPATRPAASAASPAEPEHGPITEPIPVITESAAAGTASPAAAGTASPAAARTASPAAARDARRPRRGRPARASADLPVNEEARLRPLFTDPDPATAEEVFASLRHDMARKPAQSLRDMLRRTPWPRRDS